MQHCCRPATDGIEFWISCKQTAFLSSFSLLQVIQNKGPCVGMRHMWQLDGRFFGRHDCQSGPPPLPFLHSFLHNQGSPDFEEQVIICQTRKTLHGICLNFEIFESNMFLKDWENWKKVFLKTLVILDPGTVDTWSRSKIKIIPNWLSSCVNIFFCPSCVGKDRCEIMNIYLATSHCHL